MKKNKEIWKPIVSYENLYEVSNWGKVKSLSKKYGKNNNISHKEMVLKQFICRTGHLCVYLYKNNKRKFYNVHKLVLESFVGPCPLGMEICHNDGDPKNNHVSNLRHDTHKNNMGDCKIHGVLKPCAGSKNGNSKLRDKDVLKIIQMINSGFKIATIARKFNVGNTTIYNIKNRKIWKHLQ